MKTERTSLFLMANLGSEVSRLLSALERGDKEMAQSCNERATKIFDQIALTPDMLGRREEMIILRGVVGEIAKPRPELDVKFDDLRNYFAPFAMRFLRSR